MSSDSPLPYAVGYRPVGLDRASRPAGCRVAVTWSLPLQSLTPLASGVLDAGPPAADPGSRRRAGYLQATRGARSPPPDDIAVSLDRRTGVTGEGDGTVTVRAGTRLRLALVAHGGVLHRGELPATGLGHPELGHPEPAGDGLPVVGALGLDQVDAYAGVAVRTHLGVGGPRAVRGVRDPPARGRQQSGPRRVGAGRVPALPVRHRRAARPGRSR